MAKNDFRVTSIFKIIIRICMKNVEFCRKTSKFLSKRCLLILIKNLENEISNSTSHKKKEINKTKIEREEQKHNPTSKTFLKLLQNFH